jgi:hypothetical protein
MKIERVISWYDRETEELTGEYNIDQLALDQLYQVFGLVADDPMMYNPYTINADEAEALKAMLDFEFDLERFFYQCDCFQV